MRDWVIPNSVAVFIFEVERYYINEKGMDTIRQHARDFIARREVPAVISNDGKQTPTKGCTMSSVVDVIMTWIQKEMDNHEIKEHFDHRR